MLTQPHPYAGMGTNIAGLWGKAAQQLKDITKQPGSAEAEAALTSVQDLIDKLQDLPTPPKAVWKKLVQQKKVSEHSAHAT